jgi:hypothetical protein
VRFLLFKPFYARRSLVKLIPVEAEGSKPTETMAELYISDVSELLDGLCDHFASKFHLDSTAVEEYLNSITININDGVADLMRAAARGDAYAVIDAVEKNGVDVNAVGNTGETALVVALRNYRSLGLVDYLIQRGADLYAEAPDGETPLSLAEGLRDGFPFECMKRKEAQLCA